MWTTYLLRGASLAVVVLGPLVIVLAVDGALFVLWRIHAKSALVPFVIFDVCVVD